MTAVMTAARTERAPLRANHVPLAYSAKAATTPHVQSVCQGSPDGETGETSDGCACRAAMTAAAIVSTRPAAIASAGVRKCRAARAVAFTARRSYRPFGNEALTHGVTFARLRWATPRRRSSLPRQSRRQRTGDAVS